MAGPDDPRRNDDSNTDAAATDADADAAAAEYPAAICTAWMGHTQAIGEVHYHMVRDSDFERAVGTFTIGPDAKRGQRSGAECGALGAQIPAQ